MRLGTRLGVDVGSVRVGVARCDPNGMVATPLVTLARGRRDTDGVDDLARLVELVRKHEPLEVVVGLPTGLSGRAGKAAAAATAYAARLAARLSPTPVRLVDERFSTVAAARDLRASGRSARAARSVIDQAAAVIILQGALDQERAIGAPPGSAVHGELPSHEGRIDRCDQSHRAKAEK